MTVAILERDGRGGQCVHRIGHHLPPNRHSLPIFVVEQFEKTDLPFGGGGLDSTRNTFYLLSKSIKGRTRDALAVDMQACAEVEAYFDAEQV